MQTVVIFTTSFPRRRESRNVHSQRNAPPFFAQGVIIPGQREFCREKEQRQNGLMVSCKVVDDVLAIARELSIEPDL
jgi:LDH2 family malate/lactate/ureidoglycolate dehydrogenase